MHKIKYYQLKNLVSDNLYGDSTFNMSAGAPQPHRRTGGSPLGVSAVFCACSFTTAVRSDSRVSFAGVSRVGGGLHRRFANVNVT